MSSVDDRKRRTCISSMGLRTAMSSRLKDCIWSAFHLSAWQTFERLHRCLCQINAFVSSMQETKLIGVRKCHKLLRTFYVGLMIVHNVARECSCPILYTLSDSLLTTGRTMALLPCTKGENSVIIFPPAVYKLRAVFVHWFLHRTTMKSDFDARVLFRDLGRNRP